jgi:hypothetical protein
MYPRNNASPERLAIGQVILIADGTVQSASVVITVRGQGGSEGTGGGTTVYGGDNTVYYTPTQAETNFTSFTIIASKASCISSSMTVITSAASTPGQVDLKSVQGTAQTANDNGLDINTLITQVGTILGRIIGTLEAGSHNPASTAQLAVLTDWINGGRLDTLLDAIPTTAMRGTDNAALASLVTSARMGALTDWIDGGRLDTLLDAIPTTPMRGTDNAALASLVTSARMGALTDWINGGRLDVLLDAIPTTAMRGTDSGPTNTQMVAAFTEIKGSTWSGTDTLEGIFDASGGSTPAAIADAVWDEVQSGHTTAGTFGLYLDSEVSGAGGGSGLTASETRAALGLASANLDTQLTASTTATGFASPAQVATALTDIYLDRLFATNYDPASKPGSATALLNELVENDGGVARYTVNALENGPSGSGSSAEVIAAAVWDTLQSAHKISGTYGLYLQSNSGYVPASGGASGLTSETAPFNAYEYGQVIRANMKQDISAFTVFEIVIQPEKGSSKNASQLPNRPNGAVIASGADVTVGTVDVTIGDVLYAANEYLEYTTKINDLSHPGTWRVRGTVVKSAANKLLGDFLRFTVLD